MYKGSLVLVEQANCSKDESSFSSFIQKSKCRMTVDWMEFFWRNWLCLWVACLLSIGSARVCLHIGALAGSNEWGTMCWRWKQDCPHTYRWGSANLRKVHTTNLWCNLLLQQSDEMMSRAAFPVHLIQMKLFLCVFLGRKSAAKRRTEAWPNRQHSSHLWLLQEVPEEASYCKSWGRGGEVVAAREYLFWWHAKIVL